MNAIPLFRGAGLGKTYITPVLSDVDLELDEGEALALVGENGAGKSTLTKIIAGLIRPTAGRMELRGQPFSPASRQEAEQHGIRMVLQELGLIPTLTVAENLMLDHLPRLGGFIRRQKLDERARQMMANIGLENIDPRTLVGKLGLGHQQMVEIARNLVGDCQLLILDEPTAMLTSREIDHLFDQVAGLKRRGVGIIYISHRLDELQQVADRVMVLRDGRHIETRPIGSARQEDVVRLMVGHDVSDQRDLTGRTSGKVVLEVRGLGRGRAVQGASFDLHAGEILGLAGLVGSGRTELLRLIYGADRRDSGEIHLDGSAQPARIASPMAAVRHGIGLVTEDRKSQGLLVPLPIRTNVTLANIGAVSRRGWLRPSAERAQVTRLHGVLGVRSNSIEQPVGDLSGGNQQKVVFARWLHRDCRILLLDEPTRGVDIGARSDIYLQMERLAQAGKAMVMVSSDLRELMAVCDRIAVMSAGRLVQVFRRGEWTQQSLLEAAFSGYLGTGAGNGDQRPPGAPADPASAMSSQAR